MFSRLFSKNSTNIADMNFNKFIDISLQQKKGVNCPRDPNFRNNIDLEDKFSPEESCQAARQQIEQEKLQAIVPRPRRSEPGLFGQSSQERQARVAAYKFQDENSELMQKLQDAKISSLSSPNVSNNPYTPYASQIAMQRQFGGIRKKSKKSSKSKKSRKSKKSKKSKKIKSK